jgi:hypothetical protein
MVRPVLADDGQGERGVSQSRGAVIQGEGPNLVDFLVLDYDPLPAISSFREGWHRFRALWAGLVCAAKKELPNEKIEINKAFVDYFLFKRYMGHHCRTRLPIYDRNSLYRTTGSPFLRHIHCIISVLLCLPANPLRFQHSTLSPKYRLCDHRKDLLCGFVVCLYFRHPRFSEDVLVDRHCRFTLVDSLYRAYIDKR